MAVDIEKRRARNRRSYERLTEAQRERRREQDRERQKQKYHNMTPEQRARKLACDRVRLAAKREQAQAAKAAQPVIVGRPQNCDRCVFLIECRYLVATRSPIHPYCFPNSKFYHRYVAQYGAEPDPQPEPAAAVQGELWAASATD